MDDPRQNKPTGIPRPSKIPQQASKLPVPRTSSLRASPSRETLGGPPAASGSIGTLRNPKLRSAPSRDQLAPSTAAAPPVPPVNAAAAAPTAKTQPLRSVSSPHNRNSIGQAPSNAPRTSRYNASTIAPSQRLTRPSLAQPTTQAPRSGSTNPPGLRRRLSEQWISASTVAETDLEMEEHEETVTYGTPVKSGEDELVREGRTSSYKPRLSLAERTIETLAQLPSSPSVKGKANAASWYDPGSARRKPPSRPTSRASRPGSSHQSDGSGGNPETGSRHGSVSGADEGISNFRNTISSYKNPLSTIQGTPLRGRKSIPSLQTPLSKPGPQRTARASIQGMPSPTSLDVPRSRTPSPEKRASDAAVSRIGFKTVTPRPSKRPSINGLFQRPAASAGNKASIKDTPRKVSSASQMSSATSCEGTNPSSASVASSSTALTVDSAESVASQTARKTSAALREQIAKAKAAKRAAARPPSSLQPESALHEPPVVPADNAFDFGLSDDPFNQRRDDQSKGKILQGRIETARTSGRLNIAAMGLREIPTEILNMYNLESVGRPGSAWAESVDLTRFVAADNELEMIDDSVFPDVDPRELAESEDGQENIFAGLETLDLHGNMLISLPTGLRWLSLLTSLNLSQNRLANNCLEVVSQVSSLRDLKMGGNLLYGPLDSCFSSLESLEILDLHGNNLSALPSNFGNLSRLRILNLSENSFESLPFDIFAKLPLTELVARKNQLRGTLIPDSVPSLPSLQSLDISSNQLGQFCSHAIDLPALHQLCLSTNRLQSLPDVGSWKKLVTLAADENNINAIPEGFTKLEQLRSVDFSSNDIRVVPAEIGRMENLAMLRLSGNPLREKKFSSLNVDEIKSILAQRLEPPTDHLQTVTETISSHAASPEGRPGRSHTPVPGPTPGTTAPDDGEDSRSDMDDFATPPTSAPASPERSRSRAPTVSGQLWPIKPGGVLDRSNTQSSTLHPVTCSKLAAANRVYEVQLHHNLFTSLPESLTFFADTMTALSLAHNQLVGESYMGGASGNEVLDLPALKELNLASNHVTGLGPLISRLNAPNLQKLDVSFNRIAALPLGTQLRAAFPNLTVLLASNNHLVELDPESIRGLRVVDAGNNDISHLNPRIGLLGGSGGLERLDVSGNRFRVPRWNVLERGTEATLRWLRGRVPVAEMGAWKGDDGDETSLADLD